MDDLTDYRGDCWKAYQDVALRLRIMRPGESFEFIVEKEKHEKIHKVIFFNDGEVLSETLIDEDVRLKVRKTGEGNYGPAFSS